MQIIVLNLQIIVLNFTDKPPTRVSRPGFSRTNYAADTLFEVKIEVTDSEYKIYFNGEPLSLTFPHAGREDMKTANHGTSLYITAIMQDHGSFISG